MRRLSGSSVLLVLFGLACQPPSADASMSSTLDQAAIVVDATADEEQGWGAVFEVASAPADEYLLFASRTAPTTADLGSFDPAACTGDCSVPGLGTYLGRERLSAPGKLTVRSSPFGGMADEMHFVLVRKSEDRTPLAVTATVGIEGGGAGCANQSNPDPPVLTARSIAR